MTKVCIKRHLKLSYGINKIQNEVSNEMHDVLYVLFSI